MPARAKTRAKAPTKKPVKKTAPKASKATPVAADVSTTDPVNLSTELSEVNKELMATEKELRRLLAGVKALNSGKTGRTRKTKDPNHPKRSRSAYIIFCNENRSSVQTSNPDLGAKDITRKLATMWKALPDKKRVPYDKKAAADKVRYETEMAAYKPS
jgi:hypothetical protein